MEIAVLIKRMGQLEEGCVDELMRINVAVREKS